MSERDPDELELGIHAFVGAPRTGKTHRALLTLLELCTRHNAGGIVVDSCRAQNFRAMPHVDLSSALGVALAGRVACWTPEDAGEFDRLFVALDPRNAGDALDERRHVVVLVDELHTWTSTDACPAFARIVRTWSHAKVSVLLVSQRIGRDVGQTLLAASPLIRVFRMSAPWDVRMLLSHYGVDAQRIATLPDREYKLVRA